MTQSFASTDEQRRAQLANMRQELLAPAAALVGYSEILHDEGVRGGIDEAVPDLERILSSARELFGHVDRLLDPAFAQELFKNVDQATAQKALQHDLRTPINIVKGYGEMMLEEIDELGGDVLKADLIKLLTEADRMFSQLDRIVDFTRDRPGAEVSEAVSSLEQSDTSARLTVESGYILVVDDNKSNRDLLSRRLTQEGHRVATAGDGNTALAMVRTDDFDVVLLDVMMPGTDGFTVCRQLKQDEDTGLVPVLIMTALDAIEDRIKGIEAGADDYLIKPVNNRELLARIATVLRLKRAVDSKIGALRTTQEHFAKFVPEAVKRLVAINPDEPELAKSERDVSVLFLDITGYSRLSERLAPEALNQLVERYFSAFLERIHEGEGDMNETSGDGFMAIFQDSDEITHARRAVEAALSLRAVTATLNAETDGPPLAVHMGINSGVALVGSTQLEGAHGARWTFTATGPVTNIGARMAGAAESHQILIGPETAHRVAGPYQLKSLGRKRFKNIAESVHVHSVLGRA